VVKKSDKDTAKKTVKKKTVSKKKAIAKKKTVAKKPVAKKSSAKPQAIDTSTVSPRERYEMIATMAYYRAEARDFEPGYDVDDWLACEQFIDEALKNS
jgi:hypothetical protein